MKMIGGAGEEEVAGGAQPPLHDPVRIASPVALPISSQAKTSFKNHMLSQNMEDVQVIRGIVEERDWKF